jgi:hypothetical protein
MSQQLDGTGSGARCTSGTRRFRLVAVALDDPGDAHGAFQGVVDALRLQSRPAYSMGPGGLRLHVRLPLSGSPTRSETAVLAHLRASARVAGKAAAVVVDGRASDRASEQHNIADVDEILDWLLATGRRTIVRAADVRSAFVLDRLRHATAERPDLLRGHIQVLQQMDHSGRTDYLATLAAYFDHGGDVARAADSMFMHPNTVRYRLRRMKELTGLDLDDPIDRFVAEFQLRVLRRSPGEVPNDGDVVR